MENPQSTLSRFTLESIRAHRDPDWVNKEKSYHEMAVAELNSLVRKYNAMAPYAVRRPYYLREVEIGRLYDACAPDILQIIVERTQQKDTALGTGDGGTGQGSAGGSSSKIRNASEELHSVTGIVRWLRVMFHRWFGIKNST